MNNSARRTKMKPGWLSILMLVLMPWLSGCANGSQPPKPPISLPFEVQKAGSKVETEIRIVERKQYSFSLQFSYKEGDEEDRKRVRKLTGSYEKDRNGNWIDAGIPTPLKFKINIIDAAGERPMLEQEIPAFGLTSWGGDSFGKIFAFVILDPGHYRVSVESMEDAPKIVGTTITFMIGFHPKP